MAKKAKSKPRRQKSTPRKGCHVRLLMSELGRRQKGRSYRDAALHNPPARSPLSGLFHQRAREAPIPKGSRLHFGPI